MKNKIKWFISEKGYGYIEYKKNDIFIFFSTSKGETIELKLTKNRRGYTLVSFNA